MACKVLFGVGFHVEGVAFGVQYKRSELRKSDETVTGVLEDIDENELIGVEGLRGSTSGNEIDQSDLAIGSPACVKALASSTGHSDEFYVVPEYVTFPTVNTLGGRPT
ncbi:Fc.00g093150.m01.CDS01 [Cosmosporella sp. VM-42]